MSGATQILLVVTAAVFLLGSAALRRYVDAPQTWMLLLALALYTSGNLLMVRLMRETGLAVAVSVSAVLQLVLINVVAFGIFGERPRPIQLAGIALGIIAVALIVWPAGAARR
ncbi:hypothetical protein [Pseudoruegeria sp. HB172150]|uniref:EamA family transporter n=1 Tax=Pseudoruegeria sp. HB172150 TaxID=2721164 RepID=UPI0015561D48|nr:hypothetical protein [Pseudoruegeria sp. HB172150]